MAVCDPSEITRVEQELARNPFNLGVGVIDTTTGTIHLFPYNDTDAYCAANPTLQVMAGHEAAAAMAGIPRDQARGFALNKQGGDWLVRNQSHLNRPDAQPNGMQMHPDVFDEVVAALRAAGITRLVVN